MDRDSWTRIVEVLDEHAVDLSESVLAASNDPTLRARFQTFTACVEGASGAALTRERISSDLLGLARRHPFYSSCVQKEFESLPLIDKHVVIQ
jgi:hypothetical protein